MLLIVFGVRFEMEMVMIDGVVMWVWKNVLLLLCYLVEVVCGYGEWLFMIYEDECVIYEV